MGTQKNSMKTTKKTSKLEVSSEVAKKGVASHLKLGPTNKKTAKSQGAMSSKSSAKAKGNNEVNSHQSKNSGLVNGKSSSKGKSGTSGGQPKKAAGFGRNSLDSTLGIGETVCREVACEGLATSGGY